MKRFAIGFAAGAFAVYGGLAAAYAALSVVWPERLPAPAISRLEPLDEKLRFIREHPSIEPRLLAVGSSITWRQIDGASFETLAGGPQRFLNGATGYLKIHQTRDLLDFYLDHYDDIRSVLIMTGPSDFTDCSDEPAAMLDHDGAATYAFGRGLSIYYYLRYFSPQRYLRGVMSLSERMTPLTGDLFLDKYGSGPLQVPASMRRGLRYGSVELDPSCVDALVALSSELTERTRDLIVVFAPVHPEYRRRFPEVAAWTDRVVRELEERTDGDSTRIIRMIDDPAYRPSDFFDAFHLQWPAVRRLSRDVVAAILTRAVAADALIAGKDREATGECLQAPPTVASADSCRQLITK